MGKHGVQILPSEPAGIKSCPADARASLRPRRYHNASRLSHLAASLTCFSKFETRFQSPAPFARGVKTVTSMLHG
jgi:hypothetical protein